jgi:hypothetical protein
MRSKPTQDAKPAEGVLDERETETAIPPAKKDPHRSPLVGLRGAFGCGWSLGLYRVREDAPTRRTVPIKAIWRGSIRKPQVQTASARETRHAKPGDSPEARRIGPCPRPDGQFRQPFSSSVAPRRMREPAGAQLKSRNIEFWKIRERRS